MSTLSASAVASGLVLGAAFFPGGGEEVIVRGSNTEVHIGRGTLVSSLVFSRDLATAGKVSSESFELAQGARIVYEKSAGVANQSVASELVLLGDATIVNDNGWTHMAHMLRIDGRLVGSGTLTVDGAGDGGVLLAADSRESFTGPIRVVGGNLIVGHPGALGAARSPTVLSGGRLSLYGGETDENLVFTADAGLHTGVGVTLGGDVIIGEGATARLDTGGGNQGRLLGILGGAGDLVFRGGGRNPELELAPFTLGGDEPNTLAGRITVERGTLALAKPRGVTAVVGELHLGGGANLAAIRLDADEQIADTARVVMTGDQPAMLWTNGHAETLGALRLETDGIVRMGDGADLLQLAASAAEQWRKGRELIVEGWSAGDHLHFGRNGTALAPGQVAAVGFRDPAGLEPGLYTARLTETGEVLPEHRVDLEPRDEWQKADAERAALYEIDGLTQLSGPGTHLAEGSVVSFFGDSITWQHRYMAMIERAFVEGEGTRNLGIVLRNRGINGGGVRDLRDGSERSARADGLPGGTGNAPQASFAELLAEDHPVAVVIYIGINDVTWRGTTPEQFTEALTTIVRAAHEESAVVVLATLLLHDERPDGSNADDPAIEHFAELTRAVARAEGATLVDLRRAAVAWLQNHNRRLRLDGTLEFEDLGLLTYDGIHPTGTGNHLIAELIADGLQRALAR